jgi:hypothetical protein
MRLRILAAAGYDAAHAASPANHDDEMEIGR